MRHAIHVPENAEGWQKEPELCDLLVTQFSHVLIDAGLHDENVFALYETGDRGGPDMPVFPPTQACSINGALRCGVSVSCQTDNSGDVVFS